MKYYCFQHFLDVRNETETPTVALGKLSLLGSPIRHTVPPGFSCQAWVSSSLSLLHQQADSFPMHHLWSLCYKAPVRHCCCSVGKSCPTLCNPMDCSTLGSSLLHCLLEFAQIHIHGAGGTVYLIFCLLILLLTSIFSSITVFSNELAHKHQMESPGALLCWHLDFGLHLRWPKTGASTSASVIQWIFRVSFF